MKQFEYLFLVILIYLLEINNNVVVGKKVQKKTRSSSFRKKTIKYSIPKGINNTENIIHAYDIIQRETCLKFTRTNDILAIDATFFKSGRDCSSNAYIIDDYISFGITVNEDCIETEKIQKLIYWNILMRYQFSRCLPNDNGQGHITQNKMEDVINTFNCDVRKLFATKIRVFDHQIEYSGLRILKKDDFTPRILPQINYATRIAFLDIQTLNSRICKDICKKPGPVRCENHGYKNPKKCDTCLCPFFYTGKYCRALMKPTKPRQCGPELLEANLKVKTKKLNLGAECFYRIKPLHPKRRMRVTFIPDRTIFWNCNLQKFIEIKYLRDKSKVGLILCERIQRFTVRADRGVPILVYHTILPYTGFNMLMKYNQI